MSYFFFILFCCSFLSTSLISFDGYESIIFILLSLFSLDPKRMQLNALFPFHFLFYYVPVAFEVIFFIIKFVGYHIIGVQYVL